VGTAATPVVISGFGQATAPAKGLEESYIVVCQVGTTHFGLAVDNVIDTEEIVVKPLSAKLRDLAIYSGATILGDGSVIMILDPGGLAATLGASLQQSRSDMQTSIGAMEEAASTSLLLFRAGTGGQMAVPLALVTRLEEIDVGRIEITNGQRMVQYRGKLMPLVPANSNMALRADGNQPVLVFSHGQQTTGLLVDQIIDIVEDAMEIDVSSREPGTIGSAIVRGAATDILDIGHFMDIEGGTHARNIQKTLLLIDPSDYFRALLLPVLKAAGYRTMVSPTLADAERRLRQRRFDIIVCDVEHETTAVSELAGRVRGQHETAFIGLATRAAKPLLERTRGAGFFDVVGRYDRDGLLASIGEALSTGAEAA